MAKRFQEAEDLAVLAHEVVAICTVERDDARGGGIVVDDAYVDAMISVCLAACSRNHRGPATIERYGRNFLSVAKSRSLVRFFFL